MRVCVVAEFYPRPTDPVLGVWAHRQALAAKAAGAEVTVLALDRVVPSEAAAREAARGRPGALARALRESTRRRGTWVLDGIEVEYVPFASPPRGRAYAGWHRWARGPLARALERRRRAAPFDLVHAHYPHLAGAAARRWTGPRRVPLVVSVHGGDVLAPSLASPPARALVGQVLRTADGVMCNSADTLRRAAALAGSDERMRVVHLGAEPPAVMPPKHAGPTVATVAHVVPRKRHEDVLHALALLDARIRYTVVGGGPELPRLRELAERLGVRDRVTWAGELPPERALDELARCHAMAMPSVDEAFGVAYAEALACGVPAIGCAGEGGPEELAALGPGMTLVPPRDPRALAGAIERVLGDPSLPAAARATAERHLSWEACGGATVAAYEDALRR